MNNRLSRYIFFAPWLFLATAFIWVSEGDKILAIITGLLFLYSLAIKTISIKKLTPWLVIVLSIGVYFQIQQAIYSIGSRETRALIVGFLFLFIFPYQIVNKKRIILFLFTLSFSSLVLVFKYQVFLDLDRRLWAVNAIPLATIIGIVFTLSLSLIFHEKYRDSLPILLITLFISIISIFMTETRGVMIAISAVTMILLSLKLVEQPNLLNAKNIFTVILIATLSVGAGFNFITERFNQTKHEFELIRSKNLNSSAGLRIQAYNVAIDIFQENPVLGVGNHKEIVDQLYKEKKISKKLHRVLYWNFHNNFLNTLVLQGIVGLILLLTLMCYPLWKALKYKNSYSYSLASIPLLYFFSSLTDTPFTNGHSLLMYILTVGIFLHLTEQEYQEKQLINNHIGK